jgi:hypothetical protein
MALPKAQAPQDWLTQCWNIVLGERVAEGDDWLKGPIGEIGGIADRFIDRLARDENLTVHRNEPGAGLLDSFQSFPTLAGKINPNIERFYQNTLDYNLDVWTQWKPVFGSFNYLVYRIFGRRIQQLNLPRASLDTAYGLKSEILTLKDAEGVPQYRVWFRRLKRSGEVVYSGVYTHCTIPSGERCVKVVFPLPQGNATVIMHASTDDAGNLELISNGKRSGDPGFYFLVEDRKGTLWKHYLSSFTERIFVYQDDDGDLRADHNMTLWGLRAYDLHYKMTAAS